mmetsp:Transcript_38655/g.69275  ORF Transcript_38655/g.69275 Transcript_38655/m.69275 type:complete len:594 (-) Transcript_38655:193-1974(-)
MNSRMSPFTGHCPDHTSKAFHSPPATLSLPLDGAGRLAGDVVHDAVHAAHLVADAGGDLLEKVAVKGEPVRGHPVAGGDRAEGDHVRVRSLVALHPHRAHWQENCKRLPDLIVEAELADGVDENLVHSAEDLQPVALRDVADHAHREAGAGEGVARDERLRNVHPLETPQRAHLVFEQLTQRLDEVKVKVLGETAHVVVALDSVAVLLVAARRRHRLDDIWVKRPLHQKLRPVAKILLHLRAKLAKHVDKLGANRLTLGLRVRQALQPPQHALRIVNDGDGEVQVVLERLHHSLRLLVPQQPVVYKHAVQTVADDLVDKCGRHCGINAAREGTDDVVFRADLRGHFGHQLLQHVLHLPRLFELRDLKQKVPQRLSTLVGVHHLRVVLQPIHASLHVFDRHNCALLAFGHSVKAGRQLDALIAVAHPHELQVGRLVAIQLRPLLDVHRHAAVLSALNPNLDLPAQRVHQQLHPVANAEQRDALLRHILQKAGRQLRRALHVHRVRPTGQDNHIRVEALNALQAGVARDEFRGDTDLANPASDELSVLATVVEDEAKVVLGQVQHHVIVRLHLLRRGTSVVSTHLSNTCSARPVV